MDLHDTRNAKPNPGNPCVCASSKPRSGNNGHQQLLCANQIPADRAFKTRMQKHQLYHERNTGRLAFLRMASRRTPGLVVYADLRLFFIRQEDMTLMVPNFF
jgi:hypothetical protein